MIQFQIGTCDLTTNKGILEAFVKDNYLRFYKKDKLRHVTRDDKRLPKLKITDDIFSLQIWFKDKAKNEHRLFVDGTVHLDTIKIHTVTTNKYSFNEYEYSIFMDILKGLSKISEGYLLISKDAEPKRIHNGTIESYEALLEEMFSHLSDDKKNEVENVYNWLLKSNDSDK